MIHRLKAKLSDINAKYVQSRYMTDLNLVLADGSDWPEESFEHAINVAIQKFQEHTQVILVPDPVIREPHDYDARDYNQFAYMNLYTRPVKSVELFEVKFPSSNVFTPWPKEWVKLNPSAGQIQLVPTSGTISQILLGQGSEILPLLAGNYSILPQLFHVSYTPGFLNDELPLTIVDAICKLAVIEILTVASDTIYKPGVTSFSVSKDGVTSSMGILNNGRLPAVFASKIGFYLTQLYGKQDNRSWDGSAGDLGTIKKSYAGLGMAVA